MIAGLLLIAVAVGVWWVGNNFRNIGTDVTVMVMKEGLKELDVPSEQRQRMHARIDEVGRLFKEGEIDEDQLKAIFRKIGEGPLMPAGVSLFVKRVYIRDSGLDEAEKEAAHIEIQRFARGVIDESIPEEKREAIFDMISTMDPQGNRQFKQKLTDAELRAFIEAADEAGVPTEVPEINFADEFDKAIDEALGQVNDTSSGRSAPGSDAQLIENSGGASTDASSNELPGSNGTEIPITE